MVSSETTDVSDLTHSSGGFHDDIIIINSLVVKIW